MPKSIFSLLVLDIGLILVQTTSAVPTPDEKSSPADSNPNSAPNSESNSNKAVSSESSSAPDSQEFSDSEIDEEFSDDYDKISTMTCLLFGAPGCAAKCRLRARLYGTRGEGICTDNQVCQCDSKLVSFYQHWNKRFNSVYTYRAILGDNDIYQKTMEIFKNPLRTGKQYKELLKPVLTPYQYNKLKVADITLAAKFTKNYEPDKEAIQKYIDETLKSPLKQYLDALLTTNYKENFEQSLKNIDNKGTLYNITTTLGQLQNETLNDIFEKHLKERDVAKPEISEERKHDLDEVFENLFLDYIINKNNQQNSPAKKSTPTKKVFGKNQLDVPII